MKKNNPEINPALNHNVPLKVLIAPLDWGLGHTTRVIPVIHSFLTAGCQVLLAGNANQKMLLQAEFPHLTFVDLEGYNVKYSQHHRLFMWKLLKQLPYLHSTIKKENNWLHKIVHEHNPQVIISDNRYGLHHPNVFSILITHQLYIRSPFGKNINRLIQKMHNRFIEKFNACWVPDQKENGLGGELSHPDIKPAIPVYYTGWLSRFKDDAKEKTEKHLLVLLSGPEPQRTIFEEKIFNEIKNLREQVIIVRGLPANKEKLDIEPHVKVYNHLPASELNKLMLEASFIIGRCGYSTIMDLARLKKKSILVPTPGQTEQEYLAGFLSAKKIIYSVDQHHFSLTKSMEQANLFNYTIPTENPGQLNELIHSTIKNFTAQKQIEASPV